MTHQLTLDIGMRPALAREDFLVTQSNAAAVALIDQWPKWPSHAAVLIGAPGSGKTHLAQVFARKSKATTIEVTALTVENVPEVLSKNSAVIENCGPGNVDERALFHLFNLAHQQSGHILLTAIHDPTHWKVGLPDLASRLAATPVVAIQIPDDDLLKGVIIKHFHDRQINVPEAVISYIAQRIPRSLQSVRQIVTEIDQRALAAHTQVTRPFVARILSEFTSPELFETEENGFT